MSKPSAFQLHSQENFDFWNQERQAVEPYFQAIYPQVEPLFEGAEKIVDLGAGEGHSHEVFPDLSSKFVSVDLDKRGLRKLRDQYPEGETVVGNINKLPFRDDSFDAALSMNAIGGNDIEQGLNEVARVLKPGGTLVVLYDLPRNIVGDMAASKSAELPADLPNTVYVVPILDNVSGNVDSHAFISEGMVDVLAGAGAASAAMIGEQVKPLLGEDWMNSIYGDKFMVATYAKLFTRLVRMMQAEPSLTAPFGQPKVVFTDSLARRSEKAMLEIHEKVESLSTEMLLLTADYETDAPHFIDGKEVSSLHIDELVLPRVVYKRAVSQRAGTRISGKTPVYVSRAY